ncbi:MAG: gamma-glutamyl-gamma-aminobutyrate hydrolase family protein [Lachnospiraceae bacterium]
MKKIGIATSIPFAKNYIDALSICNATFLTLPTHYTEYPLNMLVESFLECDGLLLPGGGDIFPLFFASSNTGSKNINVSEDIIQLCLCQAFLAYKKPILGICKGMQIINVACGGTIEQDLFCASAHAYTKTDQYHITFTQKYSVLDFLYGASFITNSAHHQGIGKLGTGLSIMQSDSFFVPEAIVHHSLPVLGVQWHPERMMGTFYKPTLINGAHIFHYFLSL